MVAGVRRSQRVNAGRNYYTVLHMSVQEATRRYETLADIAATNEIFEIFNRGVFQYRQKKRIRSDEKRRFIRSFLFYKEKFNRNRTRMRLKARLVAGGHQQDREIYTDNRAPTVSIESILTIIAIAAAENRFVSAIDIGNAFLEADMTGPDVLMVLDKFTTGILTKIDPSAVQYIDEKGEILVKLNKALYGCLQSAKAWFDHLKAVLIDIGFVQNSYDECVFNRGVDQEQVTIAVYVDDLLVTSKKLNAVQSLIKELQSRFKEVKFTESTDIDYVSLELDFGDEEYAFVGMSKYVNECLMEWGGAGVSSTPATSTLFDDIESEALDDEAREIFHSRVAKLLYLAKRVRPDILLVISHLASKVTKPSVNDLATLERVYRYLNDSRDLRLRVKKNVDVSFEVFIDASFGLHADGTSRSGIMLVSCGTVVGAYSQRQKIVTKSSTESEIVALSDGSGLALWLREWAIAQGHTVGALVIWQDNQSVLALINRGGRASNRTRHLNVRYFFVTHRVTAGELLPKYKPTREMWADILTKVIVGALFREIRSAIFGMD